MPQDDQHPFLKTVREIAADHIENSYEESITDYINGLDNWKLLQLLAAAESKD